MLAARDASSARAADSISFRISGSVRIRSRSAAASGALVASLLDRHLAAGDHAVSWHGRDATGREMPSGVYVYRLRQGETRVAGRMTLIR